MSSGATGRYTDPLDYAANLYGMDIELVVTRPARFDARLGWARLPHLDLVCAQESVPRVGYVSPRRASFFVLLAMPGEPAPLYDGVALQPGDIAIYTDGERFHQRLTAAGQWGMLILWPRFVAANATALARLDLHALSAGCIVRAPPADAKRLLRLHKRIGRLVETRPVSIGHPEVARALEQELIYALIACLAAGEVHAASTVNRRHAALMGRLESAIAAHRYPPLKVRELREMAGVSDRTLQACCAEFLGVGPARYLRLRWLNVVRAALLRADPATTQVAEIARFHGITQLGRFAGQYRQSFGESPSTTLRRARVGLSQVNYRNLHSWQPRERENLAH